MIGGNAYDNSWSPLNARDFGVPQNRRRIYIVGILKVIKKSTFEFPTPIGSCSIHHVLDPLPPVTPSLSTVPGEPGSHAHKNFLRSLPKIMSTEHPFKTPWIIDLGGSSDHCMKDMCPCLTRARAGSGQFWSTMHGRPVTTKETLRFMAMKPSRLNFAGLSERQVRMLIGNSMSVNVLEAPACDSIASD